MGLRIDMSHVKDKSGYVRFQMILCSQQWEDTELGNVMKFRKDIESQGYSKILKNLVT